MVLLKNKQTKKEYAVTKAEWEEMQRLGKSRLFIFLEETNDRPKPSLNLGPKMPVVPVPTVVEEVKATLGEEPSPRKRKARNDA